MLTRGKKRQLSNKLKPSKRQHQGDGQINESDHNDQETGIDGSNNGNKAITIHTVDNSTNSPISAPRSDGQTATLLGVAYEIRLNIYDHIFPALRDQDDSHIQLGLLAGASEIDALLNPLGAKL